MPSHILSEPPFGQIQSKAREFGSLADAIHKGQPPHERGGEDKWEISQHRLHKEIGVVI